MSNFTKDLSNSNPTHKTNLDYFESLYSEIDNYESSDYQNNIAEKKALPLKEPLEELETFLKDCDKLLSEKRSSLSLKHPDETELIPLDIDNVTFPIIKYTPHAFNEYSPSSISEKGDTNKIDITIGPSPIENKKNELDKSELDDCVIRPLININLEEKNKKHKINILQKIVSRLSYFLCINKKVNVNNKADTLNQI
jgi:hypothetical protein